MDLSTVMPWVWLGLGIMAIVGFGYFVKTVGDLTISGRAAKVALAFFAVVGYFAARNFWSPTPSSWILEWAAPAIAVFVTIALAVGVVLDRKGELKKFFWLNFWPISRVIALLFLATLCFWLSDRFGGVPVPFLGPTPGPTPTP